MCFFFLIVCNYYDRTILSNTYNVNHLWISEPVGNEDSRYQYILITSLYCVMFLHFIQDVKMLVSTALTVTLHVPQTVKTVRVTYKVEHVSHVNLDGVEWTVIQVRCVIVSLANSHFRIRYFFYFILTFRKALFKTKMYHFCITECEGWYGVNCSQQCSGHCRDDSVCNHVTGLCDNGCDAGWKEVKCDEGKTCNLPSTHKIIANVKRCRNLFFVQLKDT